MDVIEAMTLLQEENRNQVINLLVSSPGGQTGIAMSFYDLVKSFYRPNLQTIGSGDVDSSAIIVFLAGRQRFVTPNTTMFIHLGGRTMDGDRRFSSAEINSMAREDKIKDRQYATLLAKESGRLTTNEVLRLMQKNTVLTAAEIVKLGLAHCII
jgi:ATP-dependent protease ClpP protease subunit